MENLNKEANQQPKVEITANFAAETGSLLHYLYESGKVSLTKDELLQYKQTVRTLGLYAQQEQQKTQPIEVAKK